MGRISPPRLRQSARPRHARRATLESIKETPPWSGPRGVGAPAGRFSCAPSLRSAPWGRKSDGTKGAQGLRAQKGFCLQNPEGGRSPSFLRVPCVDDSRRYADAPLRASCRSISAFGRKVPVHGRGSESASVETVRRSAARRSRSFFDHDYSLRGGGRGACGAVCAPTPAARKRSGGPAMSWPAASPTPAYLGRSLRAEVGGTCVADCGPPLASIAYKRTRVRYGSPKG